MPYGDRLEGIGEGRLLSAILDTTESIMIVTDPRGAILKVNQAFSDRLGFSEREALGRPLWAFRSVGDAARGKRFFQEMAGENSYRTDLQAWRTARGEEVRLRWSIQIIRDEDGSEVVRVGTAHDVTEALEAELKRLLLQYVTDNLSEPLFFINTEGVIEYASTAVERVYGYSAEELVGKPSAILRPDDKVQKMDDYLARLSASGQPEMIETEAVHQNGSRIPVELRTSPVFDSDGTYIGLSSVVYDMKDRRELEDELRRVAGTDPLTGLANRLGFRTAADHEVKRARRYSHPLSVFVTDIDHFKKVNDTYGHAAGDAALVRFADMLGWSLRRPIDLVARTGGEEFVAILPETDDEGGITAAERVRATIEQNPITYGEDTFTLTASFGVSVWDRDEEDLGEAVQRADDALYEVKETGRNKVVFRAPEGEDAARMAG